MRRVTGFTLLEVLVALVVISIGMTAALRTSGSSIDVLYTIERQTYANWLAENLINQFKLESIGSTGEYEGTETMADREWFWRASIKPTFDSDVLQLRMRVSVSQDFRIVDADMRAYLKASSS